MGTNGSCQPLPLWRSASTSSSAHPTSNDLKSAWDVRNLLPAPIAWLYNLFIMAQGLM